MYRSSSRSEFSYYIGSFLDSLLLYSSTLGDVELKKSGAYLTGVVLALSFACASPACLAAESVEQKAILSTEQKPNGHKWVKAKILINASPHVVWATIHEQRQKDPDLAYSKLLSQESDTHSTLEQKFSLIPVIGTSTCVMRNVEIPLQRIDYSMIKSDRFKAFEGSWVLSPGPKANETYLELSSYSDMGLPIPRSMIEGVTGRKLQKRLANVKIMAEAEQTRVAHKP